MQHQIQQEDVEMKSKRLRKVEGSSSDIISTLPETVLETILCRLPTIDAARTSVLAKEWRYKWTKLPKLEFCLCDMPDYRTYEDIMLEVQANSKLFIDLPQVLLSHQAPIQEFTLDLDVLEDCYGLDDVLLTLLKNHAVKKLALFGGCDYREKLPVYVFSFHQLTELRLSFFDLDYQPIISGFDSLRSLYLDDIRISTKSLLHLLSNCPSLKSLTLLIYGSDLTHRGCAVIDLFKCLHGIEHLTTSDSIFEWLVLGPVPRELPTLLFHLKEFCMKHICFPDGRGLAFLLVLIKCSPNLENIKLPDSEGYGWYSTHTNVWEEYSDVWLENLLELEINSYGNSKLEMEFVKFILARSPKLKKVSIKNWMNMDESVEMLQVLLRAPRASRNLCLRVAANNFRSVNFLQN